MEKYKNKKEKYFKENTINVGGIHLGAKRVDVWKLMNTVKRYYLCGWNEYNNERSECMNGNNK